MLQKKQATKQKTVLKKKQATKQKNTVNKKKLQTPSPYQKNPQNN